MSSPISTDSNISTLAPRADVLLTATHVGYSYLTSDGNSLEALNDVTLSIKHGEILGIIGPSGSGKTTFLRLLAGQLDPTRGVISFADGANPTQARAGDFGMVFQQPALLPWRTLAENVRLPLELVDQDKLRSPRVAECLRLVQLNGFEQYLPEQLSGGMQSRAALARALVTEPRLLVMDEPFGSLDEVTAQELNEQLSFVLTHKSITTVVVTHHLEHAAFLSDRVLVFSRRPAAIVAEVVIPFQRPRKSDVFDQPEFWDVSRKLRMELRHA